MGNILISINVENKGCRKVYGYFKYHGIDCDKIISSIEDNGNKNPINLELLFPANHKIKKIFLLRIDDDFYMILGHFKNEIIIYNNSFSNFLSNLKAYEVTDKKPVKTQQNQTKTYTTKINYYLDLINKNGCNSLSIEDKKELNYISKKIN